MSRASETSTLLAVMAVDRPAGVLVGRGEEVERLRQLIEGARQGHSGTLVVLGEPGVGKTVLVDEVVNAARGVRVLRATGVESEMELPFAALQQLCAPVLRRLDGLPAPQQAALGTVFGLSAGAPPDRFLVGLAALTLVSGLGAEQPLVCVVDDAQWLDQASAQTLAFVARRLLADPVALIFVCRERLAVFAGLPELELRGLPDGEARALLDSLLPFVLDQGVRERIVAETRGIPLALVELPRGLSPAELAGGFVQTATVPLAERIKESFRRRLEALPPDTRGLLLVAAAEPVGNPVVVLRAAQSLGIGPSAAAAAESSELLEIGTRVMFRHPLVRSSVYQSATLVQRKEAHRALAGATDPVLDPDRRVWHLAQAATGTDEEVAAELETSAVRAQARGGMAASAAFLERAAALSLDPEARARRALSAAHSKRLAGDSNAALAILAAAENGPLDELQRALVDLLRGEIAFTGSRNRDAPGLLLRAAERLLPLDLRMARDAYLDAVLAAHFAGRLARDGGRLSDAVQAALRAPHLEAAPTATDLLVDGVATAIVHGFTTATPTLQQAVRTFRSRDVSLMEEMRWLWPAAHVAMAVWDDESYEVLADRHVELGRQAGLLAIMPSALTARISAHAFVGQLAEAEKLLDELRVLTEATGSPYPPHGLLTVVGWRGREADVLATVETYARECLERGEGAVLAYADYARAVLYNGLGRYEDALAAAAAGDIFGVEGFTVYTALLPELIEAAARSGAAERAREALARLVEMTTAAGTDWSAGIRARCEALLAPNAEAEELYREAIARLTRTHVRPQLARAHLLYGEWLRRQNRRTDARQHLRVAHEMLHALGMEAFAERTRRELLATGETVRKRTVETTTDLTPQEAHIARLAIEGFTNTEIGAQLFISARTVEWHLRKLFTKLGVGSRRELRGALPQLAQAQASI